MRVTHWHSHPEKSNDGMHIGNRRFWKCSLPTEHTKCPFLGHELGAKTNVCILHAA